MEWNAIISGFFFFVRGKLKKNIWYVIYVRIFLYSYTEFLAFSSKLNGWCFEESKKKTESNCKQFDTVFLTSLVLGAVGILLREASIHVFLEIALQNIF